MAYNPALYGPWTKDYDISRATVTRTSYEIQFGEALGALGEVGATFDKDAYICDIKVKVPDRL